MKALVSLLAVALVAGPALAEKPEKQKDDTYRTKKICRTQTTIGSRLAGTQVCRTRAEWEELKLQSRRTTERIQDTTSGCLRGGVCGG
jgi:hypothetical protein